MLEPVVGSFDQGHDTRDFLTAQALLQEIRGLGLTAALVRDADQEETSR